MDDTTSISDLIEIFINLPGWMQVGAGGVLALWIISKLTPEPDDNEYQELLKVLTMKDSAAFDRDEVARLRSEIAALRKLIEEKERNSNA